MVHSNCDNALVPNRQWFRFWHKLVLAAWATGVTKADWLRSEFLLAGVLGHVSNRTTQLRERSKISTPLLT